MTTAVKPKYMDVVHEISHMLFQALWEQELDLDKKVRELDSIVNKLIRKICLSVESLLLAELASVVTKKARAMGLTIHHASEINLSFRQSTLRHSRDYGEYYGFCYLHI